MNRDRFKKNILCGFGGQIIIIVLGIIIPRIMIVNYGSDTHGLVGTVSQIFSYMALLEAGVSAAAMNSLYKPIAEKDQVGITKVLSIARLYFRRITGYYAFGVLVLSIVLPYHIKSDVDKITIFFVVLFEGLSGVVSFYFIETITTLLNVDGRGFICNGVNVITKTLIYAAKIVLASYHVSIIFLQVFCFLLSITKVFIYSLYFRKHYPWVQFVNVRGEKLPERYSFLITQVAWTIFTSTDMVVLSILLNTKLSSVYSVYNLVFWNLGTLLDSIYFSVCYVLGQTYFEDMKKYIVMHDTFNSVFMCAITVLMSVAYLLCIPFIKLYTAGVNDIDYIYKQLPLLFSMVYLLSWSRYVSGNLTGIAGYAKKTSIVSLIEALINLVLSIILAKKYGIYGVLFATVIALPLKVVWCNYIADKKVIKRSSSKTIKILGANYLIFAFAVIARELIQIEPKGYLGFFFCGFLCFLVVGVLCFSVNIFVNPQCYKNVKTIVLARKNKE